SASAVLLNTTAPTETYILSLHDALPISRKQHRSQPRSPRQKRTSPGRVGYGWGSPPRQQDIARKPPAKPAPHKHLRPGPLSPNRSEEHTSELQSRENLVCRLLLE